MAVRYDKDDEVDNDLYHPIRLTKEQLHKYEVDKEKSKIVAKRVGVPVAESKVMHRLEAAEKHVMQPPYVIKPVNEGSSFGVLIVGDSKIGKSSITARHSASLEAKW